MSRTTVRRWLGGFVTERCDGLQDRPPRIPSVTHRGAAALGELDHAVVIAGRTRPSVMRLLSARATAVTTNSGLVQVPAIMGMDEIVQLAHDRLSVPYRPQTA